MAPTKKAGKKGAAVKAAPAKSSGKTQKGGFAKADWKEGFKKKTAGVSDMTLLTTITNDSINENLKKRFENAEIYTYIGFVLISVNPFRMLPIYTDEILRGYRGKNRLEMPPHVYAIAESAYYKMTSYKENQCVIISGESGAGKTEAAKKIMEYIAAVAGDKGSGIDEVKQMVLATNPLLESFGCAKTLRNDNSSRHGKYLEIEFNDAGEPVGAMITNYLLEKGRVVGQIENERNFHIFYQFTKSASAAQREAFGIQEPSAYTYTSKAKCLDVPGIDDTSDWAETLQAMRIVGLSESEQNDIFRCLAIVLWLGNAQFKENQEGGAEIRDASVPEFVAYLMEVDTTQVISALTQKTVETQRGGRRGSIYNSPLNVPQAGAARDALAKAVYNNLFEWIVDRVNLSMKARQHASYIIGVLDIYGFEIFQDNSFEQLCINYVNEKLQQIFIELTLKAEQEEYVREQIKWTPIDFFNNKVVCELIEEKRPPGVFAALNDACATAHADPKAADNSFVQRLGSLSQNKHFESRGEKFIVKHYAGDVTYNISGMTDKNKDTLNQDLWALIGASKNNFIQNLFPDRPDPSSKKRPPTAGDKIKQSANALVEKLMRSQPSYIRTIKPNQNRSPSEYDSKGILHQIKYLGLQENIRVRRAGFAYRNTFDQMVQRFYLLSPATSYAGDYIWTGDSKSGCQKILTDCGIAKDEWQMGVTKAFIRSPETLFALETMRDRYWHNMAARIQRAWRNYWRYKNEAAARIQRAWRKTRTGDDFLKLRDYGHTVLGGRKERRRFSLLGMRRFLGDYLDVGGNSATGQMLYNAASISASETVAFSSRAETLTSKFGRSSKLTPRFVVVTDKAVYILITELVQGAAQTRCERKIPLVTISTIGLSNLKDDWMAINVKNSEEPDPILVVPFKTEFVVHLLQRTGGTIQITIGPTIDYQKKKGKREQIAVHKDPTGGEDGVYKSHKLGVSGGEPANSVSKPMPKRKPGVVRPITQGKLLRPGGPSKPRPTPRAIPKSQPLPSGGTSSTPRAPPTVNGAATRTAVVPKAPPAPKQPTVVPTARSTPTSSASRAAPPPPTRAAAPPPPPPQPEVPMYKATFKFDTTEEGEMSLAKDELVEVVQKDDTGWWLVKKGNKEGWAPSNYLQLVERPKPKPAAPPPAPTPVKKTANVPSAPSSVRADANAAPVSVFGASQPGGLAAILAAKRAAAEQNGTPDSSPGASRPGSSIGNKPPAPAPKPKPAIPSKAGVGGAPKPKIGGGMGGQMDLAAALQKRQAQMNNS